MMAGPDSVARIEPTVTVRHEADASVLEAVQWVPRPIAEVFPFFADPHNLERITPAFLGFRILSMSTPAIEAGTLLKYRMRLRGVPVGWTTLIQDWDPPRGFRDVQLAGPYRLWDHTHRFAARDGGTLLNDIVRYRTPLDFLRRTPVLSWVDRDVAGIFRYRQEVIGREFGP
jgi:ligand-binding SRPBCC domain-containing protein